jgi:hypothetical protein
VNETKTPPTLETETLTPYVAPAAGCRVLWLRAGTAGDTFEVVGRPELELGACAVTATVYYRCTPAVVAYVRRQLAAAERLAWEPAPPLPAGYDPDDVTQTRPPGLMSLAERKQLMRAVEEAAGRWQAVSDWADHVYAAGEVRAVEAKPGTVRLPRVERDRTAEAIGAGAATGEVVR